MVPDTALRLAGVQKALEDAVRRLRGAIESAIEGVDDPATLGASGPVVIAHTEKQTLLERLWVVDTGFDFALAALPTIEQAIYGREGAV